MSWGRAVGWGDGGLGWGRRVSTREGGWMEWGVGLREEARQWLWQGTAEAVLGEGLGQATIKTGKVNILKLSVLVHSVYLG